MLEDKFFNVQFIKTLILIWSRVFKQKTKLQNQNKTDKKQKEKNDESFSPAEF